MKYLRITQAYGSKTLTHKHGFPIDNAGKDTKIDDVLAPFDGVIRKIYNYGNSVWFESTTKVRAADGTIDYFTVMFTHDNDVPNLKVGQKIKQGANFYQEGTNNSKANHVHIEAGRGKFVAPGWNLRSGQWVINNPFKPEKAFLLKDVTILNTGGLSWTKGEIMPTEKDVRDYFKAWERRNPTAKELKDYTSKGWRYLADKILVSQNSRTAKTIEQYKSTLSKKPVEVIKEVPVEKIVYKDKIVEVVKGDDERSMGDLLMAALRKLPKVK